jgi:excisionase family DNA binding protein
MKQYLTSGEAARICGVHINTIKSWVRKGEIEAILTPGGRWRIQSDSLLKFLQDNGMPVPDEITERPQKILVVDDDPAVCELVRGAMKLSLLSCEIFSVEDGYSGLIKVGDVKPDLMILDIMMPEINGLEVLQRLRANPGLAEGMRIMVLTGAKDSKLVMQNIESVAPDAVLFKPVSVMQLLETIQGLLSPARPGQSIVKQ